LKDLLGWIAFAKACGVALILPDIPRFPIYCFGIKNIFLL